MAKDGAFVPAGSSETISAADHGDPAWSLESWLRETRPDIVFPLIHGTGGEDGALQGYLETIGVPYVGSGVTASAVGMDKMHMKQAFASVKLPMVDYIHLHENDWRTDRDRLLRAINNALRLPYFVKPANAGSSVGVTKVKSDGDLAEAIDKAFRFDEKVLVERGLDARELEVSVLGNETPEASVPGEIVAGAEFYSYEDKYVDAKAQLIIPAKLTKDRVEEIQRLSIAAFKAVNAAGFARVDFFLERGTNRLFVNEINTIPGFTAISMYPKLWEATEMKYWRLIERLIELGIERARRRDARRESTMKWFGEVKRIS
jgi:D-alanine-D-alanine ligase